jgi:hypothetical protein
MRQITFTLAFLLFSVQLQAQGISFFNGDIRAAFAQARAQRKMVFVEVYSKSCPHCAEFEPIFKEKGVGDYYNQQFVNYRLEVSSTDVRDFLNPKKLYAPSLPLFLFFDGNENVLHFAMSNPTSAEMLRHGQNALNPTARATNYRNRYTAGERENNFLFDLAMYCRVVMDTAFNLRVMQEYARRTPATAYGDKTNWLVTQKLVLDVDNPLAKHLIDNYPTYLKKYDTKDVKPVAENLIMSSLYSSRGNQYDAAKIQQMRKYLVKIGVEPASANARTLLPEINYYFRNRQTAQATARTNDYLSNGKAKLPDYAYLVKYFNQRAADKSYVPSLNKWVAKALTLTTANSPEAKELKQELAKAQARK